MSELDSEGGQSDLTLHHVRYCFSSQLRAVKADWEAPKLLKVKGIKMSFLSHATSEWFANHILSVSRT